MVWSGLVLFGLVWSGLVWFGLVEQFSAWEESTKLKISMVLFIIIFIFIIDFVKFGTWNGRPSLGIWDLTKVFAGSKKKKYEKFLLRQKSEVRPLKSEKLKIVLVISHKSRCFNRFGAFWSIFHMIKFEH